MVDIVIIERITDQININNYEQMVFRSIINSIRQPIHIIDNGSVSYDNS